jgi:hypothetical protein
MCQNFISNNYKKIYSIFIIKYFSEIFKIFINNNIYIIKWQHINMILKKNLKYNSIN